jgi:hypothetical protein
VSKSREDILQALREGQSLAGTGESQQSDTGGKVAELPGTKTLDYIALGLLLAPPTVVVDMYLKSESINWQKTFVVGIACWMAGGFFAWTSHFWQSWRSKNLRILPYLIAAENKFWGKALIVAASIGFAFALSSILSTGVPPTVVHDPPSTEDIAKAAAPQIEASRQREAALQSQLNAKAREMNDLQQQLAARQTAVPLAQPQAPANLSAEDIAIKIGVWKTIDQRMDKLADLLNQGYELIDRWENNARSDHETLARNAETLEKAIQDFRAKMDELRDLYGRDYDIEAALHSVYVPGGRVEPTATIFLSLPNSLTKFSAYLHGLSASMPEKFEQEMIPFVGAVRRDLNAMRDWQSQVRQTAAQADKQLSSRGK